MISLNTPKDPRKAVFAKRNIFSEVLGYFREAQWIIIPLISTQISD